MQSEQVFSLANMLALAGWIVLLASPWAPSLAQRISGFAIPALLSVGYTAIVLAYWTSAEGGFSDLAGVSALFETPMILLAGWIHYLAFDLFVGAWEVRVARRQSIHFLLVVPCLALTFLFGPAGFLAFSILRLARGGQSAANPSTAN